MISNTVLLFALVSFSNAFYIEEECLNYTVYPVQYELTIMPYIYKDRHSYYDCKISITVIANAPNIQTIVLDAKELELDGNEIAVLKGDRVNIINKFRPYEYNKKEGKLLIYLLEPMMQYNVDKSQYVVKISFRKMLTTDGSGIFIVPYEDKGKKYLIVTRLSPDKAKYFFPCFENPAFESVFKFLVYQAPVRIGVQYSNTSLVVSKEQTRHDLADNYVIKEYIPSPQVTLHQVGFHYSQFGSRQVSSKYTNDTIVFWAPASKLHKYEFISTFGNRMLNLIIEYASVNRPLVYGPINIVSVPGIMEGYEVGSWNLLTNSDNRLAYVPQFTSISQVERMTYELAMQLSRIWLGNPGELQRTRWYEEWFKEGVATYLAHYLLTQYQHETSIRNRVPLGAYGLQMKHKAMFEDWQHYVPALITFNRTLAVNIPSNYKELVQTKTASLLWMVENWIGSEKFHLALVRYINTRRGHDISLSDFMTNLDLDTVECLGQFFNGSTATKVLNSWFYQTGYPVIQVNVLRDRTPNAIQLKQHKFSFYEEYRNTHYLIPISYIVQNNQNCFNCYQPRFTIEQSYTFGENLNGGWIILNTNASGYYRVNYDLHTWKLIANTLKEDLQSIPELNRAQIVNDAFALYAAGMIDQALAVGILDYLDQETSPVVWDAAISGFELMKIKDARCKMNKYLYADWQEFMRTKVVPIYTRVIGEIEQQTSSRMFRRNIVSFACSMKDNLCRESLKNTYQEYTRGKRLDPDLRQACYEVHFDIAGTFAGQGFNEFEVEDKILAQQKKNREAYFLYQTPSGSPVLDRLVMSSPSPVSSETVPDDQQPTPESLKPNSAGSQYVSIGALLVLAFILSVVR